MKSDCAKDGGDQREKHREIKVPKRCRIALPDSIVCFLFKVDLLFQFDRPASVRFFALNGPTAVHLAAVGRTKPGGWRTH
jgi:hypothetical protein